MEVNEFPLFALALPDSAFVPSPGAGVPIGIEALLQSGIRNNTDITQKVHLGLAKGLVGSG